jgi:hypothetical protein
MAKAITSHGVQSMNYHVPSVVDGSPLSIRQWMPQPEVLGFVRFEKRCDGKQFIP